MSNNKTSPPIVAKIKHIAIIMDGNGRWAKKHRLPKISGHQKGRTVLQTIIEYCAKIKLQSLTVFAFSSENINRPQTEVSGLLRLFLSTLKTETKVLKKNNIVLNLVGDLSIFPLEIEQQAQQSVKELAKCSGLTLNIAFNYGGRWDIVQASKKIAQAVKNGSLELRDINEITVSSHLSLAHQPDIDLMIRTSGELRISNFLLWNLAYSELFFTPTLWPDFSVDEFVSILQQYQRRNRRFGG